MNEKLTLTSKADSPDEIAVPSDDAVRQALLRMGGGAGGGQRNQHGGGGLQHRRGGEQMQAGSVSPDARRRRFSQNEHVPVEYVSRDRSPGRGEPSRGEPGRIDLGAINRAEPSDAAAADGRLERLERELDRERQQRQAVEKALHNLQTKHKHLEFELDDARKQHRAMLELAQSAAAAQQASAAAPAARGAVDTLDEDGFPLPRRGRGRPRRLPNPDEQDEPEPVKWWVGD